MKKYTNPSFIKLALFGLLSFAALFNSCKNFMNGESIKEEMDQAIAFANAPSFQLHISSSTAEVIPSGAISKKVTESVSLICKPYADYEFVKWQVFHKDENGTYVSYSDEEVANVVEFENPSERETSFTLKQGIEDLLIQPLCAERPKVLSSYPYYDAQGSLRDSRIIVMFDHDMSESSIYFTKEELTELKLTDENISKLLYSGTDVTSIEEVTPENKVYGYKDAKDNIFYKNITITNRSGKNILSNYGAPTFDKPNTLVIPSVNGGPDAGTTVIATLERNFYFDYDENNKISMAGSKVWNYLLGSGKDVTAPSEKDNTLHFGFYDADGTPLAQEKDFIDVSSTYSNLKKVPTSVSKKFKLYASVSDIQSGTIDYFTVSVLRKFDASYTRCRYIAGYTPPSKTFNYNTNNGTEAYFGTKEYSDAMNMAEAAIDIDLSDLITSGDGVYCISLKFADANGNYDKTLYYSVVYDSTPLPAPDSYTLTPGGSLTGTTAAPTPQLTATWSKPSTLDYEKTVLRYRLAGSTATFNTVEIARDYSTSTTLTTNLANGKNYEVYFDLYDIHGNIRTVSSSEYTRAAAIKNVTLTRSSSNPTKALTLGWTYPDSRYGIMILRNTTNNLSTATYDDYWDNISWSSKNSTTVPNNNELTPGTQYYVWAVSYPYGKKPTSAEITSGTSPYSYINTTTDVVSCYTQPNPVTNLNVTSTSTTSVTLSWTNPTVGDYSKHIIYYRDATNGNSYQVFSYPTKSSTSSTVNGLTAGHQYQFKVVTYIGDISNVSDATTVYQYTRPNLATNVKVTQNASSPSSALDISWEKPTGSYNGVGIFYSSTSSSLSAASFYKWISNNTDTSCTMTGLSASTTYYVWVVPYAGGANAYDIKNNTCLTANAPSSPSSYYTRPTAPATSSNISSTTSGVLNISWTYGNSDGVVVITNKSDTLDNNCQTSSFTKIKGFTSTTRSATSKTYHYAWVVAYKGSTPSLTDIINKKDNLYVSGSFRCYIK